jgi:transmembrane sensor
MGAAPLQESTERRRVARAEASVWIVRLHGPNRTAELEAGFRRWLEASVENGQEFERVTAVWEAAPHASTAGLPRVNHWRRPISARRWALAATVLVGCAGTWLVATYSRAPVFVTGIGEQRLVPLEDGTRLTLNSDSELKVDFSPGVRRVELIRGEAFFEVAHNPSRPFIVVAGDQQVTAVGTAFEVRYEPDQVEVTLVEGRVSVTSTAASTSNEALGADPAPRDNAASTLRGAQAKPVARGYLMTPGERLRIAKAGLGKVDEPRVEAVTAWRRGEVMLDDTALSDAVAEMNRYSKSALIIDESRIANLKVSGIYHTGDSGGFAAAVGNLYGLEVREEGGRIHLSSAPAASH